MGTPLARAREELALLVEWAVNLSVSTPAFPKQSLIQWPSVPGRALLNGFFEVINTGLGESTSATPKVLSEVQLAILRISAMGTPLARAREELALLVEWAVNLSVSTPAFPKQSLIQWPSVPGRALLNGFFEVINTGLGESTSATRSDVLER